MKPNINSVKVHPQLSNNRHPVDGELVRGKQVLILHHTSHNLPVFVSLDSLWSGMHNGKFKVKQYKTFQGNLIMWEYQVH
jgi:hypothetical protein